MVSLLASEREDEEGAWDTPSDKVLATSFFIAVGLLAGGWYTLTHPHIDNQVYQLTHEPVNYSGGKLVFSEEQRGMISDVYRDVSEEYAWCLRIRDNRVVSADHFSSLNYTTAENISFSCRSRSYNGIMHTHPGPLASVRLSEIDKKSLVSSEWVEVSCVVADPVEQERLNPAGIACYTDKQGEVERLKVVVDEVK